MGDTRSGSGPDGDVEQRCADSSAGARLVPALSGVRVVEVGHFIAAPFCTRLLADLGADVIKIEPPTGDPVRQWGRRVSGHSPWWSMHGRNKRSITLDLKNSDAQKVLLKIVAGCDILVENFRPGQLAAMGLGVERLRAANPSLIIGQISGFGQDGPMRDRAAFGVIGEAVGGLRYLTNHPQDMTSLPPPRVGVSIGDSIAGLYAAFGVIAALWQRDASRGDGKARRVDVALTESVLSMMEGLLPEYGSLGAIKQPTGGGIATAAPSNAYPTSDGGWILIAATSDPIFFRLAGLISKPEWLEASELASNPGRVARATELDRYISEWTRSLPLAVIEALLHEAQIPSSRVYTAADCAADEQFRARDMVQEIDDPLVGKTLHCGIVPHFPDGPGQVRWTGPTIGQHSREILNEFGFSNDRIEKLARCGAFGPADCVEASG